MAGTSSCLLLQITVFQTIVSALHLYSCGQQWNTAVILRQIITVFSFYRVNSVIKEQIASKASWSRVCVWIAKQLGGGVHCSVAVIILWAGPGFFYRWNWMISEFFSLPEGWFNLFNAALCVEVFCCVSDQSISALLLIVAWLKLLCEWWCKM